MFNFFSRPAIKGSANMSSRTLTLTLNLKSLSATSINTCRATEPAIIITTARLNRTRHITRKRTLGNYYCEYSSVSNARLNKSSSSDVGRILASNTMDFEFETITEMQEKACDLYRDRPSLGTKKGNSFEWASFGDLNSLVAAYRYVLNSKYGIAAGDKVALISNNRLEWAVSMYAVLSLGAQIVPM